MRVCLAPYISIPIMELQVRYFKISKTGSTGSGNSSPEIQNLKKSVTVIPNISLEMKFMIHGELNATLAWHLIFQYQSWSFKSGDTKLRLATNISTQLTLL